MNKEEALRLALETFNNLAAWNDGKVGSHMDEPYSAEVAREAITAIKAALEAKDEFVAWEQFYPDLGKPQIAFNAEVVGYVAPQRTWQGLTDDEVYKIAFDFEGEHWRKIADALEAKLKEKNT